MKPNAVPARHACTYCSAQQPNECPSSRTGPGTDQPVNTGRFASGRSDRGFTRCAQGRAWMEERQAHPPVPLRGRVNGGTKWRPVAPHGPAHIPARRSGGTDALGPARHEAVAAEPHPKRDIRARATAGGGSHLTARSTPVKEGSQERLAANGRPQLRPRSPPARAAGGSTAQHSDPARSA